MRQYKGTLGRRNIRNQRKSRVGRGTIEDVESKSRSSPTGD